MHATTTTTTTITPTRARIERLSAVALLATTLGLAAGCAVNPATGNRQLSLIGEAQEIELGRQQDEQIVAALGLYGGPELQGYVQRLGEQLAATSERPELPWTFRVVDDASVNAFALPGGFIYVTRGIMTHLNSEAELVAVLGHEIGHVTARHSVNQMSKTQLYQLGLGLGMAVSEDLQEFGGLAQTGLALLTLKHSRDDERQADTLGLRYMLETSYDPREMVDVFTMLDRLGEDADSGGRVPGWLATHPAPGNRAEDVSKRLAALDQDLSSRVVRQAAYYRQIDGMVFGSDPREGFFEQALFMHPELEFRFEFPAAFNTVNQKSVVAGVSPQQDAVVELTLAGDSSPQAALADFLRQSGVQPASTWLDRINGHPAASREFVARTQGGAGIRGLVSFVAYGGEVYRLLGYATDRAWQARGDEIAQALASFDRLTDRRALDVQPARLDVVDLDRTTTLSTFADRYNATVDLGTLARINNIRAGTTLQAGQPYKVVRGGVG